MDRIRACEQFDPARYIPFLVGTEQVGSIGHEFAGFLTEFPGILSVGDDGVRLSGQLGSHGDRSAALAQVTSKLHEHGHIPGWRNELYPAGSSFTAPALFDIERAAVSLFGIRGYGVHMNGYVRNGGEISLWVGQRSLNKPTGPGKLDQMVAGGQPAGLSLRENLSKECQEEANIPSHIAARARPVGTISYKTSRPEGLRNDILFNFDLEVPADFTPVNTDGEVERFHLWPIDTVCQVIRETDDFKFNAALVVIDFLVRHGFIEADHPDYVDIVAGLHRTYLEH